MRVSARRISLIAMKKYAPKILPARLVLVCVVSAGACAFGAAWAIMTDWSAAFGLALASAAFSTAAVVLGASVLASQGKMVRCWEIYDSLEAGEDTGPADIGALAAATAEHRTWASLRAIDSLIDRLNDDFSVLQRSATKFDLFSSDIHFSAQNLANLASGQLDMLTRLRSDVVEFFNSQSRTNQDLLRVKARTADNAALAYQLSRRALDSRGELSRLLVESRTASAAAATGERDVAAMDDAAENLGRGLALLRDTARKESEDASHIAETLRGIEDIVERTHVLATNASIEAARAGSKGTGFAVIALEVRKLAASSRDALREIHGVLESVAKGIAESSDLVSDVSDSAEALNSTLLKTRSAFDGIGRDIQDIARRMEGFDGIFSEQILGATKSADSASEVTRLLDGFTEAFIGETEKYKAIVEATESAEALAGDAKRSARVLAQLAGYLKAGGVDRNRVLRRYRIDQDAASRKYGRKEKREELLYNLEVYGPDKRPIGFLGDLSHSGLLLLSQHEMELGRRVELTVALPITADGEPMVNLSATVRRVERDNDWIRIGLSLDGGNVDEILGSLALGRIAAGGTPGGAELGELEEL